MHNFVDLDKLKQSPEMPVKHLGCSANSAVKQTDN